MRMGSALLSSLSVGGLHVVQGVAFRPVSNIPGRIPGRKVKPCVPHPRNRDEMDAILNKAERDFLSYKNDTSYLPEQLKYQLAVALMQKAASMPGQLEDNLKSFLNDNKNLRGQINAEDCFKYTASLQYFFNGTDSPPD